MGTATRILSRSARSIPTPCTAEGRAYDHDETGAGVKAWLAQGQPARRHAATAGSRVTVSSRSYFPNIDDPEVSCMLVRAQEMARYVETGALDAGITGRDWVLETGAEVKEVAELLYAKQSMAPVRWVLAVPEDGPIQSVKDLEGKVIATEVATLTKKYLARHNVNAR